MSTGAPPRPRVVRRMVLGVGVLLLLAAAAGYVWELLADPPRWEVTEQGAILTQQAAQAQFRVELTFIAVGLVLCGPWAAVIGAWCRQAGWWLALVVGAGSGAASVLAWQVGSALGPPDPAGVTGLSLGDTFPDALQTPSVAAFLLWAAAALGGLVVGLLINAEPPARSPEQETSVEA